MLDCCAVKPFLRWAGGKTWLVNDLVDLLPPKFNNYHEPFLGSAAVFIRLKSFGLLPNYTYLNDSNKHLINAYRQIKNHHNAVCKHLKKYRNNEKLYYQIRQRKTSDRLINAAEFIFLNRTCFNGLYRVNLNGEFNVPYGFKKYQTFFDYNNIRQVHKLLEKKVKLTSNDFFDTLSNVQKGDLVFIDPPYTVKHDNNGFIRYNEKIFAWEDQLRLKCYIEEIVGRKAFFIMTNASHNSIKNLFGSVVTPVIKKRSSLISGTMNARGSVNELIFSNYMNP
jgi:DNA adenine methylase